MNSFKSLGKKQDRTLSFFDDIMSIAITVLAMEIVVPQLSGISVMERYDFFVKLTCYLISFVAMCTLWYIHTNFFASHDLTGRNVEIVLHLVLMFVITLFQPLTRAIGQYPSDHWIRLLYLLDFFAMYGLVALIMYDVRHQENKINEAKNIRLSAVKEKRQAIPKGSSNENDEIRNLLKIAYAVNNPEVLQKELAEYMPQEYQQELADLKRKREDSYRMSLYAVLAMAIAVSAAVVLLIFSIWWSYLALAAGILSIFLIRYQWRNK